MFFCKTFKDARFNFEIYLEKDSGNRSQSCLRPALHTSTDLRGAGTRWVCIRGTVLLIPYHPLACSTLDIKANVSKGCLAAICLAVGKEDCHGA